MHYQNKILWIETLFLLTLNWLKYFTQAPLVCMPLIIVSDLASDHVTALYIYIYIFTLLFCFGFIYLGGVCSGTLFACLHYGDLSPIREQKPDPYEPSLVKPYHSYLRSTFPVESSSLLEQRVCESVRVDWPLSSLPTHVVLQKYTVVTSSCVYSNVAVLKCLCPTWTADKEEMCQQIVFKIYVHAVIF